MRISKKLEIKPNCVRSVQVNPNTSRGVWNCRGKAITGTQVGSKFIVDPIFKSDIDLYVPKRTNTKSNNTVIRQTKPPKEKLSFAGVTRVVTYTNLSKTRGTFNLFGKKYVLTKEENNEWKNSKIGETFFIHGIAPKTAHNRAYYYGKKYDVKFSVITTTDGAYFTKNSL